MWAEQSGPGHTELPDYQRTGGLMSMRSICCPYHTPKDIRLQPVFPLDLEAGPWATRHFFRGSAPTKSQEMISKHLKKNCKQKPRFCLLGKAWFNKSKCHMDWQIKLELSTFIDCLGTQHFIYVFLKLGRLLTLEQCMSGFIVEDLLYVSHCPRYWSGWYLNECELRLWVMVLNLSWNSRFLVQALWHDGLGV